MVHHRLRCRNDPSFPRFIIGGTRPLVKLQCLQEAERESLAIDATNAFPLSSSTAFRLCRTKFSGSALESQSKRGKYELTAVRYVVGGDTSLPRLYIFQGFFSSANSTVSLSLRA